MPLLLAIACAVLPPAVQPVAYGDLLEAMGSARGYDPLATTNGARFQAQVVLRLVQTARARDPDGPPLSISHQDWYRGVLATTNVPPARVPVFVELAFRHGQDMVVDYRASRVLREVRRGPRPELAANVTLSWPARPGAARRYSYDDTLSTPNLKVTNERVLTYRLLQFHDFVMFDEIVGISGRPTSGALGLLFQIIGEGRVVEYRMAVAPSGVQVAVGRARKAFIEVSSTLTVQPDGRTEKGVPEDATLRAIEARLKQAIEVVYHPLR